MSEPAEAVQAAPSRAEQIEAAAAAAQEEVPAEPAAAPAVLTTEDVAGAESKPKGAPDRKLVAPSIREFLRSQEAPPERSVLENEVRDLREALDGIANTNKEPATFEQTMLDKFNTMETRIAEQEKQDAEAREEEEYNNRVRSLREGVVENITARKEDFPGLVALEQQETCFNALVQRTQEGVETSEDDIASEMEDGLRTVYETLHKVYGSTPPSEDQTNSERKVTLTPGLSGNDEAVNLDDPKLSRAQRIEAAWARSQQS